jgi:hypothetical protein
MPSDSVVRWSSICIAVVLRAIINVAPAVR